MMRTKRPLREPVREAPGPRLKNYITPAGLQRLKDEHRFLMSRERPAVTQVVAWAAGNGDRSENADHQDEDAEVDDKSPHGAILRHGLRSLGPTVAPFLPEDRTPNRAPSFRASHHRAG